MHSRRHVLIAGGAILAIALFVRIITWHAFPNQIWPDEIYQSLEQAHRIVFGYGVVPWEFREGTRSWMLPGTLAGVMAATSLVTSSVTAYLGACAALLSTISLLPLWATFRTALAAFGLRGAIVAGFIGACWFEHVYFAPKALNEVIAGNLLVVGVLLAHECVRSHRDTDNVRVRSIVMATFLLTLAAMLRIQLAVAAVAAFGYLLWPLSWPLRWRAVITGAAVVTFAGLLDGLTWDYPFQSFVENVRINILVGRSEKYGTAPWYAYFLVYARIWGPWGLIVLVLAGLGARKVPILACCALAVLVTHVPIAHKEYRFAYAAMACVIALAGIGSAQLVRWVEVSKTARTATLVAIALCTVWLGASLQGALGFHESKTGLAKTFSQPQWHWARHRGAMLATKELGEDPTVCGIGLVGIYVFSTGGYTYLHRPDIPIFETVMKEHLAGIGRHVNVFIVESRLGNTEEFLGFTRKSCDHDACIYRRPGTCEVIPGYHFNEVLKRRGH